MITVAMLHSVGSNHTQWCDKWLSIDKSHFETFCKYLAKHHYKTDFLDRWYYLEDHPEEKSKKDLFLTFDDGYLDNLLVAYPILKKYGLKATIFVNPEFVDPSIGIRTLEERDGNTLGFLNWDEIRFLDKTQEIDIQSHSMSHNFYFASDKLVDIYAGQDTYHWMPWIARNDQKMYWQDTDQSSFVPFGTPVFEKGRALGLRRYFPSEELNTLGVSLYQQGLEKGAIIQQLQEAMTRFPGTFETDEDMEARYRYELFESKRILEEQLLKQVDYLCWPGGGYNDLSLKLAEKAGYKASTVASKYRKEVGNNGNSYKRIARRGLSSCKKVGSKLVHVANNKYVLYSYFSKMRGNKWYSLMLEIIKKCC